MSGVCGVFKYSAGGPVDKAAVEKMLAAMSPGIVPSSVQSSGDGRCVMGVFGARLADVSCATTAVDDVATVALAGLSVADGHVIEAASVLRLCQESPESFIKDIWGPFMLAVYDKKRACLTLARDRLGARSMYFTSAGGMIVFATRIAGILAHPAVTAELDDEGLFHHLTFGASPPPHTLFKGIRKLGTAEAVVLDKNGVRSSTTYWSMLGKPLPAETPLDEVCEKVRALLDEAVRMNTVPGITADILLSGGVDSSAMLAFLRKNHSGRIRSYTAGFTVNGKLLPGELDAARETAKHFATEHHEVMAEMNDIGATLWDIACGMDDPYAASEMPLVHLLARAAVKEGAADIFYGEGADGGFPGRGETEIGRLLTTKVARLQRLPQFVVRAGRLLYEALHAVKHGPNAPFIGEILWRVGHGQSPFWGTAISMTDRIKAKLMPPRLKSLARTLRSDEFVKGLYDQMAKAEHPPDILQAMRFIDLHMWTAEFWAKSPFQSCDLQPRMPFLYAPLVKYAMSIPFSLAAANESAKMILRKAMMAVLPAETAARRKIGFTEPLLDWFRVNMPPMLESLLRQCAGADGVLLNFEGVKQIIREHQGGKVNHMWLMFNIVVLLMWHRRWIEGKTEAPEGC